MDDKEFSGLEALNLDELSTYITLQSDRELSPGPESERLDRLVRYANERAKSEDKGQDYFKIKESKQERGPTFMDSPSRLYFDFG